MTNIFDAANRLTSTTRASTTLQVAYNGLNDRVRQTVGATTTSFVLDAAGGLPEVISTTRGTTYLHLPGVIMAQNSSGQRVYLLPDGLGSIRQVMSGTNVVAQRDFDPYGNPISTPSVSTPPYGFTGEWWEQDAQLLHLRARWYAPGEGVFLSKDSMESEPPYQYVRGNPINWVDPDGNEFKPPFSNICFFGKDPKTGKCMDPFPGLGGLGTVAQMPAVDPGSAIVKTVGILIFAGIGICFLRETAPWAQSRPYAITVPRTYPQTRQEPKSEPTLIPPLQPQPTATPSQDDSYVADSNIFMDRVEGGSAQRQRIDSNYLANPNVTLYVPAAAISEISPTPSQIARLTVGRAGGANIIPIPDGNLDRYNIEALTSRYFDENDLRILQTARKLDLPLLTTNQRMVNQIYGDPNYGRHPDHGNLSRYEIFGSVPIIVP